MNDMLVNSDAQFSPFPPIGFPDMGLRENSPHRNLQLTKY